MAVCANCNDGYVACPPTESVLAFPRWKLLAMRKASLGDKVLAQEVREAHAIASKYNMVRFKRFIAMVVRLVKDCQN